jgi:hypothetical protein
MKRIAILFLLLLSAVQAATDWTVFLKRSGPLRIGMKVDEVRRILNDPKAKIETPSDDPEECGYLVTKTIPKDMGLMIVDGRLVRIEIRESGIRTASGAGVGDTEARVKELYKGRILTEPHHYTGPEGHYLRYIPTDPGDRNYELLFETDGQKVLEYRVGTKEAVAFVEGCL